MANTNERIPRIEAQMEHITEALKELSADVREVRDNLGNLREIEAQVAHIAQRVQIVEERSDKPSVLMQLLKSPRDLLLSLAIGLSLSAVVIDWVRGDPIEAANKSKDLASQIIQGLLTQPGMMHPMHEPTIQAPYQTPELPLDVQ